MSQRQKKRGGKKNNNIYLKSIINRTILLKYTNLGSNLDTSLLKSIERNISGICIEEGFIRPNSIKILTYSNGVISGENVQFDVVVECDVCNLSAGATINCFVENITKAGIKAKINDDYDPLIIFVARDHNYLNEDFDKIEIGSEILVKILGQRFELNDTQISVIGKLNNHNDKPKITLSKEVALEEPNVEILS